MKNSVKRSNVYSVLLLASGLSACSMYSANQKNVPFDANNQHCKMLWQSIHVRESKNPQNQIITNDVGQIEDLSKTDLDYHQKMMQYERDCELPANFNERTAKAEKINVN